MALEEIKVILKLMLNLYLILSPDLDHCFSLLIYSIIFHISPVRYTMDPTVEAR